eukprot:scaffold199978_cov30-Tisochrysis_lutea.AAC.2
MRKSNLAALFVCQLLTAETEAATEGGAQPPHAGPPRAQEPPAHAGVLLPPRRAPAPDGGSRGAHGPERARGSVMTMHAVVWARRLRMGVEVRGTTDNGRLTWRSRTAFCAASILSRAF